MSGKKFIKVTSILLVISAVIGVIGYIAGVLLFGYATVDSGQKGIWLFVVLCLLYMILSVLQLLAGIKGIKGCDDAGAVPGLKKWSRILIIIAVICGIINFVQNILTGSSVLYAVVSLLLPLVLPVLYMHGVKLNEKDVQGESGGQDPDAGL